MDQSKKITLLYGSVLFLDVLEMTLLNIGLPSIASALQVSLKDIDVVVTAFIWGLTLMIPLAGWLGQRFGDKCVFIAGQLLFTGASICCSFAQSLFQLTLFRALQGIGGGLVIPVGLALLMGILATKERAAANAKLSLILRLAPALGPILGGYTLAYLGWRWLFILKLPVASLCLLASFLWLKTNDEERKIKRFDVKGLLFCSTCLGSFLIAMSSPEFIQACVWSCLGVINFWLFLRAERDAEAPIIPLHLFESKLFCQSNLLQCLGYCLLLGSAFLFSIFLQQDLAFDPMVTGWILASSTPGMFLAIPIVSMLYNRVGPRPLVIAGFSLLGGSLAVIASLASPISPWVVALYMVTLGMGGSMVISVNATSVFVEIPKELMGSASSVYSLTRQVGNCLGIAISSFFFTVTSSSSVALIAMIAFVSVGIAIGFRINNKKVLEAIAAS